MTTREQFEKWQKEYLASGGSLVHPWEAWLASRKAAAEEVRAMFVTSDTLNAAREMGIPVEKILQDQERAIAGMLESEA